MKFSCGVHIKVAFFSIWFMRSQSSHYRGVAYFERRNNRFCHVIATLSASIYHSKLAASIYDEYKGKAK